MAAKWRSRRGRPRDTQADIGGVISWLASWGLLLVKSQEGADQPTCNTARQVVWHGDRAV